MDPAREARPLGLGEVPKPGLDSRLDPRRIAALALADEVLDRELPSQVEIDLRARPAAAQLADPP